MVRVLRRCTATIMHLNWFSYVEQGRTFVAGSLYLNNRTRITTPRLKYTGLILDITLHNHGSISSRETSSMNWYTTVSYSLSRCGPWMYRGLRLCTFRNHERQFLFFCKFELMIISERGPEKEARRRGRVAVGLKSHFVSYFRSDQGAATDQTICYLQCESA